MIITFLSRQHHHLANLSLFFSSFFPYRNITTPPTLQLIPSSPFRPSSLSSIYTTSPTSHFFPVPPPCRDARYGHPPATALTPHHAQRRGSARTSQTGRLHRHDLKFRGRIGTRGGGRQVLILKRLQKDLAVANTTNSYASFL